MKDSLAATAVLLVLFVLALMFGNMVLELLDEGAWVRGAVGIVATFGMLALCALAVYEVRRTSKK